MALFLKPFLADVFLYVFLDVNGIVDAIGDREKVVGPRTMSQNIGPSNKSERSPMSFPLLGLTHNDATSQNTRNSGAGQSSRGPLSEAHRCASTLKSHITEQLHAEDS